MGFSASSAIWFMACTIGDGDGPDFLIVTKLVAIPTTSKTLLMSISPKRLWVLTTLKSCFAELYITSKGFSEDEILGSGGFGHVYRTLFPSDGTTVAIKCLSEKGEQFEKTFAAELMAVAQLCSTPPSKPHSLERLVCLVILR
ncbi:hypothetical protein NE237_026532 [Protea cynaroides]|uniref:non-specific serine/threonine protein kinase n=1 Tax=Protea cynaroides TaxID=273540 RepID=A0A9Q0H3X8_9MAGN|nr:hypothetical protein NE237_026532 [Protea cynaroides]